MRALFEQDIGFTGENPMNSTLTQLENLKWKKVHKHLLYTRGTSLWYNARRFCRLDFQTHDFGVGNSLECC